MEKTYQFEFELFDSFYDMYFLLSREGNILKINHTAQLQFGQPIKTLNTASFFDLIEHSHREKTKDTFNNCFKKDSTTSIYTKFQIGKKTIDISLSFIPKPQTDNVKNEHCFVYARDITQERKKELDLLRFYYVAENTVNPLQITDINGNMVYVNRAFIAVSGFSREELIGKNPRIFGSGKQSKKFWNKMWLTISSGKVWVGEVENKRKNGDSFYTQLLVSPILDNEGNVTGYFGIHRDLTEKRILEKQLIHTQKMESIGTLAAGVAHEVGNPLASISALVQVVQRSTDDVFVKEKLELVKSQVTRISKIIRDLVDFSRPSNYELQLTDLNQNVTEAVEITRVGTKAKDIIFDLNLNEKIPMLPLVADQIQQVFVNILLNAVDAMAEVNDNHKEKKIYVKSDTDDDEVLLYFSDTATGISEENLSKIFEPFYTTKKEGKGTGLGLWVSYGIIKSFQGEIKVESILGKGTTFIISLPNQS